MEPFDVAVIDSDGGFGELVVTLLRECDIGEVTLHGSVDTVESAVDVVVHCDGQEDPERTVTEVAEHAPGSPVVLLLGPAEESVVGISTEAGAAVCFPRSPDVVRDHLVEVLHVVVERHRTRQTESGFGLADLLHETTHDLIGVQRRETLDRTLIDGLLERFPAAAITRIAPDNEEIEVCAIGGTEYEGLPMDRDTETPDPTAAAHRTRLPAIAHDLQGVIAPPEAIDAAYLNAEDGQEQDGDKRLVDDPATDDGTDVADGTQIDDSTEVADPAEEAERVQAAAASTGLSSALAVPIGHGGEFHGVLTVYASDPFAFTVRDVKLLLALGDAAARANSAVRSTAVLEAADEERHRLRSILDAVGDAVFIVDTDGVITHVNASGATIVSRTRGELIGTNTDPLLEADSDFLQTRLESVFAGDTVRFESMTRQPGGGMPVEVRASMLTEESAVAVVHDLSDRRDTERTLRRLREGVRNLLTLGDEEVAAETAVRTMADALDASAVVYLLNEETGTLVPGAWTDDAETPKPVTAEQPLRWEAFTTDSEREINAEASSLGVPSVAIPMSGYGLVVAAVDDKRDVEYVRIVVDDLAGALAEIQARASLRRRSETLERQNRLLDEFAAVVSHDLRNPLGAAMGFLDLARETGDESHFERVERAHDRMNDLITQLLELSRRDNRLDPERVMFADLREDAQSAWSHVATDDAGLVVEDSKVVEANHDLLQELFENLFRNAVEHAGESPEITMGTLPDGFYVEDDGPGIDEGIRDELTRINRVTTDRGIGFGLSIVVRIARAHEWDLHIGESTEGGARFEFSGVTIREAQAEKGELTGDGTGLS